MFRLVLVCCLTLGCGGCSHLAVPPDSDRRASAAQLTAAADAVAALPLWFRTMPGFRSSQPVFNTATIRAYVDAARQLAPLTDLEVKAVTAEVSRQYRAMGRSRLLLGPNLFVLWRIVFDLPAQTKTAQMHFTGLHSGWVKALSWTDSAGIEWFPTSFPMVFDAQGKVTEIRFCAGLENWYGGWPDFERMSARYPRRSVAQIQALRP